MLQAPGNINLSQFNSGDNSNHWTAFGDSPYWILQNSRRDFRQQIVDLSGELNYTFNDNITSTLRGNVVNSNYDFIDYNNAYESPYTITGDGRNFQSALAIQNGNARRLYVDFLTNFNYQLTEDIGLKALLGFNFSERKTSFLDTRGEQLTIPGLYVASNISSAIEIFNNNTIERGTAVFANADLSFKDYLFLTMTLRSDWDSRLQTPGRELKDLNFIYPSVSAAFIPTKAFPEIKGKFLHRAKVSAGYVKVGNIGALGPHDLYDIGVGAAGYPYTGGLNSFIAPLTTSDPNITPEFVTTYEGNINLEFLNINGSPRITLDASAAFYTNEDQILATSVSSATGVTTSIINVGLTETNAYEVDLGFTPFRNENFRWSANIGYASQRIQVEKVTDDSDQVAVTNGIPGEFAIEGQQFPVILGTAYERDEQGRVVLNNDGSPRVASGNQILGRTTPDYILNFGTELTFKGLTLRATADYRTGHVYYSSVYNDLTAQGRSFVTAENGRGYFIFPNSTVQGSGVTNTSVLTGPSYGGPSPYAQYQSFIQSPQFDGVDENFILDASAFKLREVALSYDVPSKYLEKTFIYGLSFGVSGRNLLIITPKENRGYDDPEIGGGIAGFTQNPPTRFYTMNINLTF